MWGTGCIAAPGGPSIISPLQSPPLPPSTFSHSSLCLRLLPLSIQSHPPSSSSLRSSGSVIRLPGRQRYLFSSPSPLLPSAVCAPLLSLASGLGGDNAAGSVSWSRGGHHLSPADRSGSLTHFWGHEFIAFIVELRKCGHEVVNI